MAAKLPKGIDLLPSGRYRARVFQHSKFYSLGAFRTIGDAKAARAIALSEIARGVFVDPRIRRAEALLNVKAKKVTDSRTVRDLADEWLQHLERQGLKLGTTYTYRRHLEANLLPVFGERVPSTLTPDEMNHWLQTLEHTKGLKAAAPIHLTVAALFKFAAGDSKDLPTNYVPYVLASPVPPLNAARLRRQAPAVEVNRKPITNSEIQEIADGMPVETRLVVLLAGYCALRIGEVLALRRKHITKDGAGYWLTVEKQLQARGSGVREESPKTTAGLRTIPIPPAIVEDVEAHLNTFVGPRPDAVVFPRHEGRQEFHNPNTVRKQFNKSIEAMNVRRVEADPGADVLEAFTFHGLRHTALTRLGQAGATTAELKAYAGHSDSDSVAKYQHAERSRLAALATKLGNERATND